METGITLMGEAAQAYVVYKYVELFTLVALIGIAAYGVVRFFRGTSR